MRHGRTVRPENASRGSDGVIHSRLFILRIEQSCEGKDILHIPQYQLNLRHLSSTAASSTQNLDLPVFLPHPGFAESAGMTRREKSELNAHQNPCAWSPQIKIRAERSSKPLCRVTSALDFHADGIRIQCNTENFVPIVVPGLSTGSSSVLSLGKLCDENGYSYEWINGQKPHFIKDGIRIICNTENFVPIVVPGLTSSSSTSSSTLRTSMKQERHRSTSSSSSSSSPTATASSDRDIREREDQSGIDSSPVHVSSSNVEEMTERGNPLFADSGRAPLISEIPEWLQEFRENLVDDRVPEHRDSHASSSHEVSFRAHSHEKWGFGQAQCWNSFP